MKILIIGAGGREDALAWTFAADARVDKIYLAPGNAGTQFLPQAENVALTTVAELRQFAITTGIDLTFVGAEALLAKGIVDEFQAAGLRIFGANQQAAQLESSKRFAKDFMKKYGVKTAAYASFDDLDAALSYLADCPYPTVVKASGLAAGKGVIICPDRATAEAAVRAMMSERRFGDAGAEIVIEEFLTGFECSVLSFCDGQTIVPMLSARDHKTIGEGGTGDNTGGMGVVAPHPLFDDACAAQFARDIVQPTLAGIRAEKMAFAGVIFFGLMINERGVFLLEYNMRLGDPETQAILPLLASSLLDAVQAALAGQLHPDVFTWRAGASCCLVAASEGYPAQYPVGREISLTPEAREWAQIFIAGAKWHDGALRTAGGRVLNVVGQGATLTEARQKAYAALAQVRFAGLTYRRDIGA